jgi:hypothetical protein
MNERNMNGLRDAEVRRDERRCNIYRKYWKTGFNGEYLKLNGNK